MIHFEQSVLIHCPVSDVFGYVANLENVPNWNYFVQSVQKLSDGPVDVGTRYHQVRKSDEQDMRITAFESESRLVVQTEPGSKPAFTRRMTFLPVSDGTHLTDNWDLDLGLPGFLDGLGASRAKQGVAENLDKLRELLETGRTRLQDGRTITYP